MKIKFYDEKSILIINENGVLRKLYTPFKVLCVLPAGNIKADTWVYVEQVAPHSEFLIIYRIFNEWFPYNCFLIIIYF